MSVSIICSWESGYSEVRVQRWIEWEVKECWCQCPAVVLKALGKFYADMCCSNQGDL